MKEIKIEISDEFFEKMEKAKSLQDTYEWEFYLKILITGFSELYGE